eukprot:1380954-Rhodomonas_salina.1
MALRSVERVALFLISGSARHPFWPSRCERMRVLALDFGVYLAHRVSTYATVCCASQHGEIKSGMRFKGKVQIMESLKHGSDISRAALAKYPVRCPRDPRHGSDISRAALAK